MGDELNDTDVIERQSYMNTYAGDQSLRSTLEYFGNAKITYSKQYYEDMRLFNEKNRRTHIIGFASLVGAFAVIGGITWGIFYMTDNLTKIM